MSTLLQLVRNYYESVIRSEQIYQQYIASHKHKEEDGKQQENKDKNDNRVEITEDRLKSKTKTKTKPGGHQEPQGPSSSSSSSTPKYILDETLTLQRQLRELTAQLQDLKRKNEELKETVTEVKITSEAKITGYKRVVESLKSQVTAAEAKSQDGGDNKNNNNNDNDNSNSGDTPLESDRKRIFTRLKLFGKTKGKSQRENGSDISEANALSPGKAHVAKKGIFDDDDSDTTGLNDSDSSGIGTIFELRRSRSGYSSSNRVRELRDTDIPTTSSTNESGRSSGGMKRRRLSRKRVEKKIQEEFLGSSQVVEMDINNDNANANDDDNEDSIVL